MKRKSKNINEKPKTIVAETVPVDGHRPYQAYELEEDVARSAYHYEKDPEFFLTVTGGEWHTYSCLLWEQGFSMTQAQEKKLDKMAELASLNQGMHILDVGCGWGGPLVYLCHKYGATGHGITVSPAQIPPARQLAAKYSSEVVFEAIPWQSLPEGGAYTTMYSYDRELLAKRWLDDHLNVALTDRAYCHGEGSLFIEVNDGSGEFWDNTGYYHGKVYIWRK